jgi:hypothetical protein
LNERAQIAAAVPAGGSLEAGELNVDWRKALLDERSGIGRACASCLSRNSLVRIIRDRGIDIYKPHRLNQQQEEMCQRYRTNDDNSRSDISYRLNFEAIPKAAQDQPDAESAKNQRHNERPPAQCLPNTAQPYARYQARLW